MKVLLASIAHARSGDKGDRVNIGVIALEPRWYPVIAEQLTAEAVAALLAPIARGPVERFELPNLYALNFLVHNALDGGGTVSLRTDAQGKVASTAILRFEVELQG